MNVRVRCYARIREITGSDTLDRTLEAGATASDCFTALSADFRGLAELRRSTRFVLNAAFVAADTVLRDGDELGLLPPFGGG